MAKMMRKADRKRRREQARDHEGRSRQAAIPVSVQHRHQESRERPRGDGESQSHGRRQQQQQRATSRTEQLLRLFPPRRAFGAVPWLALKVLKHMVPPFWLVVVVTSALLIIGMMDFIFGWVVVATTGLGWIASGVASVTRWPVAALSQRHQPPITTTTPEVLKWPHDADLAVYKQSSDIDGGLRHLMGSAQGDAGDVVQQCLESQTSLGLGLVGGADTPVTVTVTLHAYLDDTRYVVGNMTAADDRFVDDVARILRPGYRDAQAVGQQVRYAISQNQMAPLGWFRSLFLALSIRVTCLPTRMSDVGIWSRGGLASQREGVRQASKLRGAIGDVAENFSILLRLFDSDGDDLGSSARLKVRMANLSNVLQEAVRVGDHKLTMGRRHQAAAERHGTTASTDMAALGHTTYALRKYEAVGLALHSEAKKAATDYQAKFFSMLEFERELGRIGSDLRMLMNDMEKATEMTHVMEANGGLADIADVFVHGVEQTFFL